MSEEDLCVIIHTKSLQNEKVPSPPQRCCHRSGRHHSCNKGTTNTTSNGNSAPSVNTPSNADGALAAVKVITTQTVAGYTVPINIGTA